jgi:RNA polymerase sigma-70 factor, ECF subfamily
MGKEDDLLVTRLQAGDEQAFAEIVDRFHGRLVRFATALVDSPAKAEDVVQDTWVGAIRGIARFEGRSSLQTWLFQICANRARSLRQKERRTVPMDVTEPTVDRRRFGAGGQWTAPPEPWPEVDDRLLAEALLPTARQAIAALPDLQRRVVTLRDIEGLTAKDVCEMLDITEANQRVLLHRGRARLRLAIEQELQGEGR